MSKIPTTVHQTIDRVCACEKERQSGRCSRSDGRPLSLSVTGKWRNWPETIFLSASIALAFDATHDGFGVMTSHTRVSFGFFPTATTLNAMS